MTAADPFDYPDEPPPTDTAPPSDAPDPILPPEPTFPDAPASHWTPPAHDDDEAAFWRGVRGEAEPDADPEPEHRVDHAAYVEWMASERRVAYTVTCPTCKVAVGSPCVRVDYRGNPTTEPIRKYPAHADRLKLARKSPR